jgi:hypothetical protein
MIQYRHVVNYREIVKVAAFFPPTFLGKHLSIVSTYLFIPLNILYEIMNMLCWILTMLG